MNEEQKQLGQRLKEKVTLSNKGRLEIISKEIPFFEGKGGLDPRVKEFLINEENPNFRRPLEIDGLEEIRSRTEEHTKDLSKGIRMETEKVYLTDHTMKVRIYNRTKEKKPVIIFFHGGGFFELDLKVMSNICKLLAQEAEAVVIAPEYRLAPEHPYQDGIDDCLESLRYVYENAEELSVDAKQISLVGDSVGGNLALGVHHLSKEEAWDIQYIGLLCPLVDFSEVSKSSWNIEHYNLAKDQELIRQELITTRESLSFIQSIYLTNLEDVMLPLVSPLLRQEKRSLPPLTMITAEFDFLRLQGEEFSAQLMEAEVPVRHIEYKGMAHAFIRKLGYYPQAADAVYEISKHYHQTMRKTR
ncbi:alpha/beta hydrolase [Alkalicoccus daliensis]|nr:alpha/beta hydrolase [Alkalicoccus daliensis]